MTDMLLLIASNTRHTEVTIFKLTYNIAQLDGDFGVRFACYQ